MALNLLHHSFVGVFIFLDHLLYPLRARPTRLEPRERFKEQGEDDSMVAYQFYWRDKEEKTHFIGILAEKRKTLGRITPESILNWGRKVMGDRSNLNDIYFVQVES